MSGYKVYFYKTGRGDQVVKEFIKKQSEATYAKILRSINLLRDNGPFLKPPYSKRITSNISELRIQGKEALRIFYTKFDGGYLLLHIFKKKTQKIPKKELKTAVDRSKEFI